MTRNRFLANTLAILSAIILPILFGVLVIPLVPEGAEIHFGSGSVQVVGLLTFLGCFFLSGFFLGFFVYLADFRKVLKIFGITVTAAGTGFGGMFILVGLTSDSCCGPFFVVLGFILIALTFGGVLILVLAAFLGKLIGQSLWNDPDYPIPSGMDDYGYLNK